MKGFAADHEKMCFLKLYLANFSKEPYIIQRGDRIAQLVVARYERVEWLETTELPETERGKGGFGSTGIA
jgi:dUTP pyrophosphatase